MTAQDPVVIIGAGIGGLACAIDLAAQGLAVTVVERGDQAGGKMREVDVGAAGGEATKIDSGPTVFTMRWVFDELFEAAGARFDRAVTLEPLDILARHAWSETERFDLHADLSRAADAVGAFSGAAEAHRFLAFCAEAKAIYQTLQRPFLASSRPGPLGLARRIGFTHLPALIGIRPFETLWKALSQHFEDPRLRQLFGRYATYNGSSPFAAPATLMLIAHVERDGVWIIGGGMQRLAEALQSLAETLGVVFRFAAPAAEIVVEKGAADGVRLASGEHLKASAVVLNGDAAALAGRLFGASVQGAVRGTKLAVRSLSATTWAMSAETSGFPLVHHNVFFSSDYRREFEQLTRQRRLPDDPTIYVCAQDRGGRDVNPPSHPDRLLLLVNAPPTGDRDTFHCEEIAACESTVLQRLERCGLQLTRRGQRTVVTTPNDFERMFPATGGALYGRASHGWMASFQRPASQTRIPRLYLAGGSTHPGAGVPMAALSGRLAAQRLIGDLVSTRRFHPVATSGGTSTDSAPIAATRLP